MLSCLRNVQQAKEVRAGLQTASRSKGVEGKMEGGRRGERGHLGQQKERDRIRLSPNS